MITLKELKEEVEPYKNTLVIDIFENIVRLVDVVEFDDDYYWVFDTPKGLRHSSCVVGWIPLKGYIEQENYDRMVRIWNLNNTNQAI
jgi:hypothetical protein